jgi:hypothetical protein
MTRVIPQTPPDFDKTRIIERPDGFYWASRKSDREFGPFATLVEAVQDMQYQDDTDIEPAETIEDAGADLGVSDWVDPDTGEPAEGGIPRLEDH